MFETEVRAALRDLPLGGLRVFQSIGSTNDEGLAWASEGAADGSLVVADEQTSGRGRSGRPWYTPPSAALALSFVLRASEEAGAQAGRLAGLGALALTEACAGLGLSSNIKWPNDILVRDRKVGGVLVESAWEGNVLGASIVGIGLNVLRASVPPPGEVLFPATCLEAEIGRPVDRMPVLRAVVSAFLRWREKLAGSEFLRTWESRLSFVGGSVVLTRDGQVPLTGTLAGLESDGGLRLRVGDQTVVVRVGELHLRPTNDRIA